MTANNQLTKTVDPIPAFCARFTGEVEKALPEHCPTTKKQYIRALMTAMRRTPKLLQCNQKSVGEAIMTSAQLGLLPDVCGQCFLIPYKTECTLVIGYQGLVELSYRSGRLDSIRSDVVCEGDEFQFEDGFAPLFRHKRDLTKPRGKPYAVYAIAEIKDANRPVYVVLGKDEIMAVKKASAAASSSCSPWNGAFETEMWKKTAIRRLCKLLPKSTELMEALDFEDKQEEHYREVEATAVVDTPFTPGKHSNRKRAMPEPERQPEPDGELAQLVKYCESAAELSDEAKALWDGVSDDDKANVENMRQIKTTMAALTANV